jgi:hypothetical protein
MGVLPGIVKAAVVVGWLGSGPAAVSDASAPPRADRAPREVTLVGQVVPLATVVAERGIKADVEAMRGMVVLRGDDGTITPLLSDEASRALFLDERLHSRNAELRGWMYDGLPFVQVVTFRVEEQGALRIPEYYCDVCTITVRYPQVCPCCQGDMELRYRAGS